MATTPDVLAGRYEVGRLLGAGGMAEVYEGRDRLLARRVAIKVLLPQYSRDPAFLTRFKREAQSAASLAHPNIVGVYDTGVQAGTNFIVMEYIEGRTLRDIIRTEGPLLPERAAEVAADVCSALSAAHARGIIHRDIKPANIMISSDRQVKVMDFGIARAVSSESITQTAAVVGTAQYISPEQAQAAGVDARTDLYSLGVCLFEMLSGRVPFTGNTPVAIAYQHVRDNPPPLRQLNPDVPASLEAVVLKAMAKNPDNRYQSSAEMREDLERARTGQRVLATPLLTDQQTVAMAGQQPTGVLGGPMTQGDPATGYDPYYDQYDYEGRAGSQQRRRSRAVGLVLVFLAIALLAGGAAYLVVRNLDNKQDGATPALVEVPDVTGKSGEAATAQLRAAGFGVDPRSETSDQEPGIVLSTSPKAGAQAARGSTVILVVSSGPGTVRTPDLTGLTLDDASARAQASGLKIQRGPPEFNEGVRQGRIISQNPNAGVTVQRGEIITVILSRGPEPTTTASTTTTTTTSTTTTTTTSTTTTTLPGPGGGGGGPP
ncbi:MAG TPA: Stk1 family PASTA domain-containing Ser/Thr kinase [Actinomycetes bacterium]|nr:Stk1 family PASTA domain-containing Ser/Thr kinase [Actinomycetes bacterium]